jgi:hypothetical protein
MRYEDIASYYGQHLGHIPSLNLGYLPEILPKEFPVTRVTLCGKITENKEFHKLKVLGEPVARKLAFINYSKFIHRNARQDPPHYPYADIGCLFSYMTHMNTNNFPGDCAEYTSRKYANNKTRKGPDLNPEVEAMDKRLPTLDKERIYDTSRRLKWKVVLQHMELVRTAFPDPHKIKPWSDNTAKEKKKAYNTEYYNDVTNPKSRRQDSRSPSPDGGTGRGNAYGSTSVSYVPVPPKPSSSRYTGGQESGQGNTQN